MHDLAPLSAYAKGLLLSALAVIAPAKPMLIVVLVLTVFDTFSGIGAARKRGEKISSAGLRRTISKGLVYMIAILTSLLMERYIIEDAVPACKMVAGAIAVVEAKSIFENLETILGQPIFSAALAKLGSKNDDLHQKPKRRRRRG